MSSYVVDPKTINIIVTALEHAVIGEGKYPAKYPDLRYLENKTLREMVASPADLGKTMYSMNINAVEQRYPEVALPGTYTNGTELDEYKHKRVDSSPLRTYKQLSCYLYQCSEGDVDELPLYKALREFKSALAEHMIERSPEYDKEVWG